MPELDTSSTLQQLGLQVFERGWLSSNTIVCAVEGAPTTLIDSGYATHAALTLSIAQSALRGRTLNHIVNTHLHADHCGGNAVLQQAYPGAVTSVPLSLLDVVQRWDTEALTYARTDQRCDRFLAAVGLGVGSTVRVGHADWRVLAAPGHDPHAVMMFEPRSRVLIAGDALWERRLAIVFPELEGADGFAPNLSTMAAIESLDVALVIPGHGRPFQDVQEALESSRRRLRKYQDDPDEHAYQAQRALLMFHLLEHQSRDETALNTWLQRASIFRQRGPVDQAQAQRCIDSLVVAGAVMRSGGQIQLPSGDTRD